MRSVRLILFGPLRDIVGKAELEFDISGVPDGAALFAALCLRHPALLPWRESLRLAVNREYVPFERALGDGDEVGLIPPVNGG